MKLDFSKIPNIDKWILMSALNLDINRSTKETNEILSKAIKEYNINLYTGDVEIVYNEPIEMVTISIQI